LAKLRSRLPPSFGGWGEDMTQLSLFNDATWPSTQAIAKLVFSALEEGPHSLSVNALCSDSGLSAHSVRSSIRYLQNGHKIGRVAGRFDERGRPVYALLTGPRFGATL